MVAQAFELKKKKNTQIYDGNKKRSKGFIKHFYCFVSTPGENSGVHHMIKYFVGVHGKAYKAYANVPQ